MARYNHKKIESKWQTVWDKQGIYRTRDEEKGKENFYTLVEFPYPSGNLHVGHWYAFSVPDIFARMQKMRGKNVLFPIGFDAFGLPAENAAIKRGINPRKWTYGNIDYMRKQLRTMGPSFDWSREVVTCDPEYYQWTQWIFLQFFKKGLAYQAETNVNWCLSCKTVLANEQVIGGLCERCDSEVEQRKMKQWLLRITDYAEKLLAGLDKLDWPEEIKESQRNWIGKSEGAEIEFPIVIPVRQGGGIQDSGSPIRSGMTERGMKRFVLLHGYSGNSKNAFLPWLRGELEKRGYNCTVPNLPHPFFPKEKEQVNYVLKNINFDENTILVGHSLGGVVAMKVLENLDKKIAGLILVGTPIRPKFKDHWRPIVKTFSWQFDFEKIKSKAGFVKILSDLNDYAVYPEYGRILHEKLGGELIETYGKKPHFTGSKEPVVLENLLPPPLNLPAGLGEKIRVFTTRPDTIFGATYMVLAPEHPLVAKLLAATPSSSPPSLSPFGRSLRREGEKEKGRIQNVAEVKAYIEKTKKKTELQRMAVEKDKTGVELKGVKAINPATKEEIPVWIADYVLMGYGTGAIMAVPAHDERDFEFAKKYRLPIRDVVHNSSQPPTHNPPQSPLILRGEEGGIRGGEGVFVEEGVLVNSGKFNGMASENAKGEITEFVKGIKKVQYKLRDWVISRQRYWGVPIPVIHCPECGVQSVPEKDLPVKLPELKDYKPKGDGRSPLAKAEKWVKTKCPACGGQAERETDTMDTFIDSSWYFLRYTDPKNQKEFASLAKMKKWMPVDVYSGGAEHTTMHLLYSRFWIKAMHDLDLVKWDEPYVKRLNRGLILGPDGQKMSKSRGNVVDPDDYVKKLGADTVRMYLAFIGPYNQVGAYPWNPKGIMGVRRFLQKVWRIFQKRPLSSSPLVRGEGNPSPPPLERGGIKGEVDILLHKTIKKVTEDIEAFKFNTAISALMILVNEFAENSQTSTPKDAEVFLKLLAPFAPHMAEELWHQMGHRNSIHKEKWPQYDPKLVKEEIVSVAVQVNGKLRAMINLASDASENKAKELAMKDENVQRHLGGKKMKKVVYVRGKIINFVVQ